MVDGQVHQALAREAQPTNLLRVRNRLRELIFLGRCLMGTKEVALINTEPNLALPHTLDEKEWLEKNIFQRVVSAGC